MNERILVLTGFLISLFWVSAQEAYEINPLYPVHSLDQLLKVYPDPNDSLTAEIVLRDSTLAFLKGDQLPRLLDVGTIYWGKLRLKATDSLRGWTLHFEDKMIGPPAWTKGNGKVDVYAYAGGRLLFHQKTGAEYSKQEKQFQGNWILNAVELDAIPPGEAVDLVIRAEGNSIGYPAYFNLSARSPDQPFYHEFNQFNSSFNIFLFGITFIVFLYHLLLFAYLREGIYFWFCLWLFFCVLVQAMTVGLIIGNISNNRYVFWFLMANGIFYSFWFFGRKFVDSKNKFPKLDKAMLGLALLILAEIILMATYVVVAKPQTYFTGVGMHYVFLNIYSILGLVLSVILTLKKDPFARYFGIGSIIASLALIIGTLWSMGALRMPVKIDPYATGIFFQIVIYSFGITYRQRYLARRAAQQKIDAERSKAEVQRITDLAKIKTKFFTNISHEFRTPLTLIKGPIKEAQRRQQKANDEAISISSKDFGIIERNALRLEGLVDELLELSKIESGKAVLKLTQGDPLSLVRAIVFSFESMAERAKINLDTNFEAIGSGNATIYHYDRDKLEKIVSNIMSNAFKYTPAGGKVTVQAKEYGGILKISITDTGKGIDEKDLPHIFDRFYRVEGNEEKGSGIGLALSRELVELHNGTIWVDSLPGEGTQFSIEIPVDITLLPTAHILKEEAVTVHSPPALNGVESSGTTESQKPALSEKPLVLVVEDNKDLQDYVADVLRDQYAVLIAPDGIEGERLAIEHLPDIIISDVMMPHKNGYEMCRDLRENQKTCHIPIVMLTAKAGHESKMEGLEQGADAFLTKPFSAEELLLRMKNLTDLRKQLWQKIRDTDGILVDGLELTSMDDALLKKVLGTIEEKLDDENLTVETLSKAVGFSRAQLHRKLKALLNKSPNQLINEIRLNKAHQLLQSQTGSVSEIAFSVGYANMSYFSKRFREKFGLSPSEFLAKIKAAS